MRITSLVVPVFVLGVILYSLHRKIGVFDTFIEGAKENIKVSIDILPSLVALMLAVEMFKASGALTALTELIEPITRVIGIPSECVPLALMRPISGSGALSMLDSILAEYGPDSFIGRVASVLMGSTETTLYTVAVYFGAVKIRKTRHALPSALVGDFMAFLLSALAVRLFLSAQ